jgi:hypothetical protein
LSGCRPGIGDAAAFDHDDTVFEGFAAIAYYQRGIDDDEILRCGWSSKDQRGNRAKK